jgi:hypothetical protein
MLLPPQPTAPRRPSPLWALYAFTFANSVGTGVVTSGIYFLTKHGYGFTNTANYLLAATLGAAYIAGALGAGPALAALRRAAPGVSSRSVLRGLMVAMAALCALPILAMTLVPSEAPLRERSPWAVWVMVLLYSPLTGVLWPMIESYVSGGRSGDTLRATIGRWNIVWSSALVFAYIAVSPMVADKPALAVLLLGAVHLGAAGLLRFVAPEPAPHSTEHHTPHPPVYTRLLVTFRLLLPMSYIVSSTLGPYLPAAMDRLRFPEFVQTVAVTAWLLPRVLTFLLMERWAGWHGRWFPALVGGALLLGGFAAAVLGGRSGNGAPAVTMLLSGLAMFGVGMAVIYSGALYYAMEVGQAQVEAGGKHEALIGVGYTTGPLVGLAACVGVQQGWLRQGDFEPVVLGVIAVLAATFGLAVVHRVVKNTPKRETGAT